MSTISSKQSSNIASENSLDSLWSYPSTQGDTPSHPYRAHTSTLVGNQLYVFGGGSILENSNKLHILNMDTMIWSSPPTSGHIPPPMRAHTSTLVEHTIGPPSIYVFGGGYNDAYYNDVYILNTETLCWLKPATEGTIPPGRRSHSAVLWKNSIVIAGGGNGISALGDVYMLDLSRPILRWSQLEIGGPNPSPRGYAASILVKNKILFYGGTNGHKCLSDLPLLDLETKEWSSLGLVDSNAPPRMAHTATRVGPYVFFFGGYDGHAYSNMVQVMNLATASEGPPFSCPGGPSARAYHTTVFYNKRLYILGGYDGHQAFDDMHCLDLSESPYLASPVQGIGKKSFVHKLWARISHHNH
ncbi:hypothetical protein CLU79DRAFT_711460 [Phycomyces nitens]|nr:hypothetical protein CLU79DRAFT_711460 [Phycomyces nitens]